MRGQHDDPIPARDDLAKALIAYSTGHLGISTTMRAHEGIGTSQAHLTISTAPMTGLLASFTQDGLIRPLRTTDMSIEEHSRL